MIALRSDAAKVLLGWTLFGLSTGVSVSLMAFTFDRPQDLWVFGTPIVGAWVWAAMTPLVARLVRRHPLRGERRGLAAFVFVAASPLLVIAHEALFQPLMVILKLGSFDPIQLWCSTRDNLRENFLSLLTVGWGLLAVLHAVRFSREEAALALEAARLEAEVTEATLAAARAEVDPAFLLGTLDALGPLILRDGRTAEEVVVRLGDLLRRSYQPEGTGGGTREEIALSIDRLLTPKDRPADS